MSSRSVYLPIKRKTISKDLTRTVLLSYYAFIFSIPFLVLELGFGRSIPSFLGYLFTMTTVLKPRLCYGRLHKALWFFATYLGIYLLFGLWTIADLPEPGSYLSQLRALFQTMVQLLVLFWVSSNLLAYKHVARVAWFTFAAGCIVLAIIQSAGFTGGFESAEGRVAAFGTNPNMIGGLLGVGLLALIGLAYGQEKVNRRARAGFWFFSAILFLAIIRTGSRGAIVALVAGCCAFVIQNASLSRRFKLWVIGILSVVSVVIASYSIEAVRVRWERSFVEGDTSGRDAIFDHAEQMFLEKPILGWGPINHGIELGRRLDYGKPRDFHNLFFHILTEVGVVGAIPFLLGLLVCCRCAWRARRTSQGILPLALLANILVVGISGTAIQEKWFWLILAYAAASGRYPLVPREQPQSFVPSKTIQSSFRDRPLAIRH